VKIPFLRDDRGQSLILVAGGFAMLCGAVALSVDWGYSYAQRRAMSNAGQAGALAAGRLLAGSVVMAGASVTFSTSEELLFDEACKYALKNIGSPVEPSTYGLTVEMLDSTGTQQASIARTISSTTATATIASGSRTVTPSSMTNIAAGTVLVVDLGTSQEAVTVTSVTGSTFTATFAGSHSGTWAIKGCNNPTTSTVVPSATRDLRATLGVSYPSIFGGVIGMSTIQAGGSGRSRIGGSIVSSAGTFNGGTPWAMVRHYDPSELTNTCGSPCNPSTVTAYSFWGNESFGNYKGLIDFSKVSQYEPTTVDQLITSWDKTGSLTAGATGTPKPDKTTPNGCTSALFDTAGTVSASYEKACSIPNWMYYGYSGTLSVSTSWASVGSGQHAPTALGTRSSICTSPPSYLFTPSCGTGNDRKGDWVETFTGGNAGSNISGPLLSTIQTYGTTNEFSTLSCGGGCTYGKALTVMVYLWDCAQEYSGGTWNLIQNRAGTDCADMSGTGNCNAGVTACWTHANPTPARVHVFTYTPFTFYEGLVSSSNVKGFWGGGFGAPSTCPSSNCALNSISNTTFLVGDP